MISLEHITGSICLWGPWPAHHSMPVMLALLGGPQKPSPKPCLVSPPCLSMKNFSFSTFGGSLLRSSRMGFFKSHLFQDVSSHSSHWSSCFQISRNPRAWVQYVWCDIAKGQRKHFSGNPLKLKNSLSSSPWGRKWGGSTRKDVDPHGSDERRGPLVRGKWEQGVPGRDCSCFKPGPN